MASLSRSLAVAAFVADNAFYVVIGILILNLLQRKHQQHSPKKRLATLYLAVLVLALMGGSLVIVHFRLSDILLIPLFLVLALLAYGYRAKVFPFRLACEKCAQKLPLKRLIFFDSNCCEVCDPHP